MPEKFVEDKVAKVEEKINKEVEKAVEQHFEKEDKNAKEQAKQEMKKKIGEVLLEKTKQAGSAFGGEFKSQAVAAITAAFGFLIALSWRDPIAEFVNGVIADLGFGTQITYKFLSAIVVTLIAVIFLVLLAKWNAQKK